MKSNAKSKAEESQPDAKDNKSFDWDTINRYGNCCYCLCVIAIVVFVAFLLIMG